jgi:hypothetical protein
MGYKAPAIHRRAYIIYIDDIKKQGVETVQQARAWLEKQKINTGSKIQIFYDQYYGDKKLVDEYMYK